MCLIRVRKVEEEVLIPFRPAVTTTVITPIPPAPPPPPPSALVVQAEPSYSTALVPVSAPPPQSHYAYDAGSNSLVGVRAASSEYSHRGRPLSSYSIHTTTGGAGTAIGTTTTMVVKGSLAAEGGVSRTNSRTHRTHSRRSSAVNVINGSKDEIVIGPDGEPYRLVHRHRHRHRSGSRGREKSVTRYSHDPDAFRGSRRSVVSVSNGPSRRSRRSSVDYYSDAGGDPRSSVRYIEARGSMRRIEGAPEARERERDTERYSYGGGGHRRTGSVTYVNPRTSQGSVVHGNGHRRSVSGGIGMSREKVILVDRE